MVKSNSLTIKRAINTPGFAWCIAETDSNISPKIYLMAPTEPIFGMTVGPSMALSFEKDRKAPFFAARIA